MRYFSLPFLLLLMSVVLYAEPSGFNSGGALPPKQQMDILQENLFNLSNSVKNIRESQEGLRSVFDGQSRRVQELSNRLNALQIEQREEINKLGEELNRTITKSSSDITALAQSVSENFATYDDNFQKLKDAIAALGTLVMRVNTEHGSAIQDLQTTIAKLEQKTQQQEELLKQNLQKEDNASFYLLQKSREENTLQTPTKHKLKPSDENITHTLHQIQATHLQNSKALPKNPNPSAENHSTFLPENIQTPPQTTPQDTMENSKGENLNKDSIRNAEEETLEQKDPNSLFTEAQKMLKSQQLEEAKIRLEITTQKNYKPARGNFLLGEIAYQQKRYRDAIYYYKISATRYDKAEYMPRLLLNSAKSFSALKEEDNAQRFLTSLVSLYPESQEATEAKKLIK